jgi:hypothetical protein
MFLVAGAVALQFIVAQLYDPAGDGAATTVWRVLDPLMLAAMVMVLIAAFSRKRRLDAGTTDQPVYREYLEANVTFYYSAALFLVLLWNWLGFEWVSPPNDIFLVWLLIDVTLPLLLASTGLWLLREVSGRIR